MSGKAPSKALERILEGYRERSLQGKVQDHKALDLLSFVPAVSERYERPEHLAKIATVLDKIEHTPQRFCYSAAPRHGKSELIFHFIARYMARHPTHVVAYCAYSAKFAERKSVIIQDLVRKTGVPLSTRSSARDTWMTQAGGSLLSRGVKGSLTGEGVHLLVCDDPFRDRAEAESGTVRENVWDWWTSVPMTRLEPGASVIVTHTRWHPDDLIGRLTNDLGWEYCNIPALDEEGNALWPARFTREDLLVQRATSEYDWASMYMGQPQPRGGAVFRDTNLYTKEQLASTKFKRITIGIDAAYTAKKHSDYSAAVVLGTDDKGMHYVLDVKRMQCEATAFGEILKGLRMAHGSPPIYWYIGGIEKPVVELFGKMGIPVKAIPARDDKFVRAQAVAAAWNAGKVLVPEEHRNWMSPFLSEVLGFTGLGDKHDDQVDALAAAYVPSSGKTPFRGELRKRVVSF